MRAAGALLAVEDPSHWRGLLDAGRTAPPAAAVTDPDGARCLQRCLFLLSQAAEVGQVRAPPRSLPALSPLARPRLAAAAPCVGWEQRHRAAPSLHPLVTRRVMLYALRAALHHAAAALAPVVLPGQPMGARRAGAGRAIFVGAATSTNTEQQQVVLLAVPAPSRHAHFARASGFFSRPHPPHHWLFGCPSVWCVCRRSCPRSSPSSAASSAPARTSAWAASAGSWRRGPTWPACRSSSGCCTPVSPAAPLSS